jgi:hypothetical protein
VRALSIDRIARFSDPRWHTTRVSPRAFLLSADASERAFGTFPPAAGVTLLSGAGSGQYELRSTWPYAVAVSTAMSTVRMVRTRVTVITIGAPYMDAAADCAAATRAMGTRYGEQLT